MMLPIKTKILGKTRFRQQNISKNLISQMKAWIKKIDSFVDSDGCRRLIGQFFRIINEIKFV